MRINSFPRGFLALVGANNMGRNVDNLAEIVSPVVDIGDNYLAEQLEVAVGGCNPLAGFVASTLVVPAGEVWKVFGFNASIVTGGAVTIAAAAPAIRVNGVAFLASDPIAIPINTTTWRNWILEPIWLPSGAEFGIFSSGVAGVPVGSVQVISAQFKA